MVRVAIDVALKAVYFCKRQIRINWRSVVGGLTGTLLLMLVVSSWDRKPKVARPQHFPKYEEYLNMSDQCRVGEKIAKMSSDIYPNIPWSSNFQWRGPYSQLVIEERDFPIHIIKPGGIVDRQTLKTIESVLMYAGDHPVKLHVTLPKGLCRTQIKKDLKDYAKHYKIKVNILDSTITDYTPLAGYQPRPEQIGGVCGGKTADHFDSRVRRFLNPLVLYRYGGIMIPPTVTLEISIDRLLRQYGNRLVFARSDMAIQKAYHRVTSHETELHPEIMMSEAKSELATTLINAVQRALLFEGVDSYFGWSSEHPLTRIPVQEEDFLVEPILNMRLRAFTFQVVAAIAELVDKEECLVKDLDQILHLVDNAESDTLPINPIMNSDCGLLEKGFNMCKWCYDDKARSAFMKQENAFIINRMFYGSILPLPGTFADLRS